MFDWFKKKNTCVFCGKEMTTADNLECESCKLRHEKQQEESIAYEAERRERMEQAERRTASIWAEELVKAWRK